jgi:hypothetical protein
MEWILRILDLNIYMYTRLLNLAKDLTQRDTLLDPYHALTVTAHQNSNNCDEAFTYCAKTYATSGVNQM